MPTTSQKFRFSDVVYAIETTPVSLRKWLDNKQLKLIFWEKSPGWNQFTFTDLAVLGVMRRLVDLGVTVGVASFYAHAFLLSQLLDLDREPPLDEALVAQFAGVKAYLFRSPSHEDGWDCTVGYAAGPPAVSAYLALDLHAILRRVLARAAEIDEGRQS